MPDDAPHPPDADLSPFDRIVDTTAAENAAGEWARGQLNAGRIAEDVAAEMVAEGWDADAAAALVEEVRQLTRAERGVLTRDDVVAGAEREYRRGYGGWIVAFPSLAAARRLMHAIASWRRLRAVGKRKPGDGVTNANGEPSGVGATGVDDSATR